MTPRLSCSVTQALWLNGDAASLFTASFITVVDGGTFTFHSGAPSSLFHLISFRGSGRL